MNILIRNEQIENLENHAEEDFVQKVKSLIKQHRRYVAESYRDDELDVMVRNGIKRARSHGIESELALFRFVDVMFGVAPNFDEHSMIKEFLAPGQSHPDERVAVMVNLMTAMDWEEVKKVYDPAAWGIAGVEGENADSDITPGGSE
jgi:hypothetical protein